MNGILQDIFQNNGENIISPNYSLFKIGRSKDVNEIYYDIQIDTDGKLNLVKPVKIYWIKHTSGGKIKPLGYILSPPS